MIFNQTCRKQTDSYLHEMNKNKDEKYSRRNFDVWADYGRQDYLNSLDELGTLQDRNKLYGKEQVDTLTQLSNGNTGYVNTRYNKPNKGGFIYFTNPNKQPNAMNRVSDVDVYSRDLIGIDTKTHRSDGPLSGVSIDRFIPLVPCVAKHIQNPVNIVPEYWVHGGECTRTYMQNSKYINKCGYTS